MTIELSIRISRLKFVRAGRRKRKPAVISSCGTESGLTDNLEHLQQKIGVPSGPLSAGLDAALGFVAADEVEGEAAERPPCSWRRDRCDSATDRP